MIVMFHFYVCVITHTYINNRACKITEGRKRTPSSCVTYVSEISTILLSSFSVSTRSFPPSLLPSVLLWNDAVKSLPSIFFMLPLSRLCRERTRYIYISVTETSFLQLSHREGIDRRCVRRRRDICRAFSKGSQPRRTKKSGIFVDRIAGIFIRSAGANFVAIFRETIFPSLSASRATLLKVRHQLKRNVEQLIYHPTFQKYSIDKRKHE